MKRLLITVLLILAANSVLAAEYVLVQKGDRYKLYRVNADLSMTAVEFQHVKLKNGGPVDPPPIDPPEGSLAKWTMDELKKVPDHRWREETKAGLAATYVALAQQMEEGKLPVSSFPEVRREVFETVTGALNTTHHWKDFDDALVAEINRRKLKASETPAALRDIAKGLTEGRALDPRLIPVVIEIVTALIEKDRGELFAAVGRLVLILIGNIGG